MKSILLSICLLIAGVSISQTKNDVDSRLVDNHGDEIYQIHQYRYDYYKFLLWELDFAYEVVNASDLQNVQLKSITEIVDENGMAFNPLFLDYPNTFNFQKYNFERQKEQDVYYDLGDGRVLKFTALKIMWKQFDESGLNTKN